MYGSVQLWLRPLPRELDHPVKLSIGGRGYDPVSEGVHKLNLAQGDCLVGFAPGSCVGNGESDTSSEIVGWESGARTCLHVRPGLLTMLECSFNKTTHHPTPGSQFSLQTPVECSERVARGGGDFVKAKL
jgi:hypothetical protein